MWPVPFIHINWIGLSVGQMFYISLDWILFYRTHAHTYSLTDSLIQSFIQNQVEFVVREWTLYSAQRRLLFRPFKVYSAHTVCDSTHIHILQACYYYYFIFHSAYPCIVQGKFKNSDSLDSFISVRRKPAHTIRWKHTSRLSMFMFIDTGWLVDWLTASYTLARSMHIGTYVKLKHIVREFGVYGERSFHSQSHRIAIVTVHGGEFEQHWATFRRSLHILCYRANYFPLFALCFSSFAVMAQSFKGLFYNFSSSFFLYLILFTEKIAPFLFIDNFANWNHRIHA